MNVPFSPPDIAQLEIDNVVEVLKSGWITTGPKTKEFENKIAEYCETEKAVARTAPEVASIREAPPKVPTPSTNNCKLPPINKPVVKSPMTKPVMKPANTGEPAEETIVNSSQI